MTLTEIHDYWATKNMGLDAFWAGKKIVGICVFSARDEFCSLHFEDGDYLYVEKNSQKHLTFTRKD